MLKKLIILAVIAAALYSYLAREGLIDPAVLLGEPSTADMIQQAFRDKRSDIQVEGKGAVNQLLPDDMNDGRHQRFILTLDNGHTLLITHNIDLAPRVDGLRAGDTVQFFGEYEWNPKGGVIHWTHRDPAGKHVAGWLKHEGKKYQ